MQRVPAPASQTRRWWRGWLPALVGVLGVVVSLWVWQALMVRDHRLNQESLRSHTETRLQLVEQVFADTSGAGTAAAGFFAGSDLVEQREWGAFSYPLLTHQQTVLSIQWAPRVWHEAGQADEPDQLLPRIHYPMTRARHEAVMEAERDQPYQILELDPAQQQIVPAGEREQYFPLAYQATVEWADWPVGLDWWSYAPTREAMKQARDTGEAALSPVLDASVAHLLTEEADERVLLLFSPIFFKAGQIEPIDTVEERREELKGFVVMVFRVADLVGQALQRAPPQGIDLHFFDTTVEDAPVLLHLAASRLRDAPVEPFITPGQAVALPHVRKELQIGGRQWLAYATPTEHYLRQRRSWTPEVALGSGLVGSALLTALLLSMISQTQRARQEAAHRRTHARQQSAIARLGLSGLREPALQALMEEAVQLVTHTLTVDFASVLELKPGSDRLRLRAGGRAPEVIGEFELEASPDSLVGYTLLSNKPVVVEDLAAETRFRAPALQRHGVTSGLSTVIVGANGEPCGVVGAYDTRQRTFTQDDINFLQAVANVLGQTIVQRRTEAELRESEERFRTMADAAPALIWVADPEKQCTYFNRPWLDFTGRTTEQELGEGWIDNIHAEDRDACLSTYHHAFDHRKPFRMEYRMRRTDGAYRWVLNEGVPRFTPDGTFAGYIGACIDVTTEREAAKQLQALNETLEQRVAERTAALKQTNDDLQREVAERQRAEEQLRESKRFVDSVLENIPHMIFIKAAEDLRFVRFNKAGEALLGYDRHELMGKNDYDFFPPSEAAFFVAKDREVLEQGQLQDIPEERIHTRDKGVRILHTKKVPLFGDNGQPTFLLGISEDITERKEAERQLRELTAALQQSNQELEQFAYIASHDLQEPLRKVEGFSEMLQEHLGEALDDDSRDYLQRMYSAVQRMRDLINGLLTYSRVTTKRQPIEAVDLSAVAREVVSDLELRIEETAGEVQVDPLPTIQADPLQMRQLLQNLIGNGLKFHKADQPPRVRVAAEMVTSDGTSDQPTACRLTVQDNGIGIDPKDAGQLFMPFRRLHGRSSPYAGTGIGLAVCRKIVERHGGTIQLQSTPGEGATFIVTLPVPPREPTRQENHAS